MNVIERITYYENIMQAAEKLINEKFCSAELREKMEELSAYYGSDEWKADFAADEAGQLPQDLKRGVLSEDGIYDLLERYNDKIKASDTDTSRFISLILRHKPDAIGITLDEHGWADVSELIAGIGKTRPFDMEDLERIVREDEKQRYSFNEDRTLIRANQGHSIPVDVELEKAVPPEILFHGTGMKYEESIDNEGLIPKSRLYVHLSGDEETARKVGVRHGKLLLYRVKSGEMHRDGYEFFRSVNGVWLTKTVPVKYLEKE